MGKVQGCVLLVLCLFTHIGFGEYDVQDSTSFKSINCKSISLCEKKAKAGDVHAMVGLALHLLKQKKDKQAYEWAKKAALKKFGPGQLLLGLLYADGAGVKVNDKQAVYWFEQASAFHLAQAYNNLGVMYRAGRGVKQNDKVAFRYFQKAAKRSDISGQMNLGMMYLEGRGTKQDVVKGRAWLKKAKEAMTEERCHIRKIEDLIRD